MLSRDLSEVPFLLYNGRAMLSYNKYNLDILKLELKVQGKTVSFEQNLSTCSLGLVFSCKLTQTETLVDQKVADIRFAPSSA